MITFRCNQKGCKPRQWEGSIKILKNENPCEIEVSARDSYFHIIVGKHAYGNYICIPNWNIGTELAALTDTFWNQDRLRNSTRLNKTDACTVATALETLSQYL